MRSCNFILFGFSEIICEVHVCQRCSFCLYCIIFLFGNTNSSVQLSSVTDHCAMKAMSDLFDMLESSFKTAVARTDHSDLVWSTNLAEAIAQRGKAREAAAKMRLQEVEQAEKDLLEVVRDEMVEVCHEVEE
jgi:hypothetical protein